MCVCVCVCVWVCVWVCGSEFVCVLVWVIRNHRLFEVERGNPLGGALKSNPLPSIGPKLRELCIEANNNCRRLHVRERYASNAPHIFFTKEILEKSVSFNPKQVITAFPFWASSDDVVLRVN